MRERRRGEERGCGDGRGGEEGGRGGGRREDGGREMGEVSAEDVGEGAAGGGGRLHPAYHNRAPEKV